MKINILLPYKEEFQSNNSGAVSILVEDHLKYSKFYKNINVYGVSNNKINKKKRFITIPKSKFFRNHLYVKNFLNLIKNKKSIVEIHNRPSYFIYLKKKLPENKYILFLHNDPNELRGSKSMEEKKYILKNCDFIIFLSKWIKNKFFLGIEESLYSNFDVIYPGSNKAKTIPIKKKIIFFSGKLNRAKGYDLFCKATKEFLIKNKDWKILSAGSEPRRDIPKYNHVTELGQIPHKKVINILKKSKISIAPSTWDEPLGRLPIESAANGTVCISSSNGGLIESNKNGLLLEQINEGNILKALNHLLDNNNFKKIQSRLFKKFDLTDIKESGRVDEIRKKLITSQIPYTQKKKLKILHISNFNDNSNGRLYYSTQRKINLGFTKLEHNLIPFDEKLFFRKKISLFKHQDYNNKILEIVENFYPDLIILGHSDAIWASTFKKIKIINPHVKIIRIYIDSISKEFFKLNSKYLLNNIEYIDQIFLTSKVNQSLKKFFNKISYIPNICDSSIENLKNFKNNEFKFDLFFALSHGQNRGKFKNGVYDERDAFINLLDKKTSFLKKYFIATNFHKPLWGESYFRLLSKCRMGLNLSRGSYQNFYSSDRISSMFGNGLLVFLEKKTNLQKFFKDKKDAVFFSGISDLITKLKYYKLNHNKGRIIAKNGYAKYHKLFNSKTVCNYILKKINLVNDKKKYIWENL